MKATKNLSKKKFLRVDLQMFRLIDCYWCGKPNNEPVKILMHNTCWDVTSPDVHGKAERAFAYAMDHGLSLIPFRGKP